MQFIHDFMQARGTWKHDGRLSICHASMSGAWLYYAAVVYCTMSPIFAMMVLGYCLFVQHRLRTAVLPLHSWYSLLASKGRYNVKFNVVSSPSDRLPWLFPISTSCSVFLLQTSRRWLMLLRYTRCPMSPLLATVNSPFVFNKHKYWESFNRVNTSVLFKREAKTLV